MSRHSLWRAAFLAVLVTVAGCGRKDVDRKGRIKLRGEKPVSLEGKRPGDLLQKGRASWYGQPYHGRKTSNGETYNMWALTAAHKQFPFGTVVKVVNRDNGRAVHVRINDRGPFVKDRIIDLSRKAARELDMEGQGLASVAIYLAEPGGLAAEPPPRVETQPRAGGYWTVQVGSFGDRRRADAMRTRMTAYSDRAFIETAGGLHRVRVGRFAEKRDADRLARQLLERENLDSWVTFVD